MEKLTSIPGIGKSSEELLEVAGFLDVEALARAGVDDLVAELERANEILKIAKRTPPRAAVEKWIKAAQEILGVGEQEVVAAPPQMPVNYELNPEVAAMLDRAPCAIPLPGRLMMENNLVVADIPPAILLNRYSGDLEVRITNRQVVDKPEPRREAVRTFTSNIQRAKVPESRLEIDTSRVKTFEEAAEAPRERRQPGETQNSNDRVALLRAPREETNRGKNPNSRWYIRGVLHTHPIALAFGAFVTVLLMLVTPLSIAAAALLLLSDQFPATFPWVPKWILAFPVALLALALIYLIFGLEGKCRICGQRLFWPRNCLKNSKAHHVPGFGYILPVALHMLTFRWFRCTYCGTPVRLKK